MRASPGCGELWPQASGALVYGDSRDHAALAYLTHFTPKLEPSIALIPRNGAPRLMVGGGANMIPAAKPLTWVADLVSLRPTGKTIAQWREGLGGGDCVCIGIDAMPTRLRRELDTAFGGATPEDRATDWWQGAMRTRVAGAGLHSCRVCDIAGGRRRDGGGQAQGRRRDRDDPGRRTCRHPARRTGGTQPVQPRRRTHLRPFSVPVEQAVDPLQVYVAVRHAGYWVDGFVVFADKPSADLRRCRMPCGASFRQPSRARRLPLRFGDGIGLAPEEPVRASRLEAGGVYSVRATSGQACVSAMVAVSDAGIETLWSAA